MVSPSESEEEAPMKTQKEKQTLSGVVFGEFCLRIIQTSIKNSHRVFKECCINIYYKGMPKCKIMLQWM